MFLKEGAALDFTHKDQLVKLLLRSTFELSSQEKARRLFANQLQHGISSWQTRDLKLDQFGGAIRIFITIGEDNHTERLILSFSGLPEIGDEAVMLCTAIERFGLQFSAAKKIAGISRE